MRIYLGGDNNMTGILIKNYTFIPHPKYNEDKEESEVSHFDIGIIILDTPIEWKEFKPTSGPELKNYRHFAVNTICLPQKEDIGPQTADRVESATFFGWGLMNLSFYASRVQRGDFTLKYENIDNLYSFRSVLEDYRPPSFGAKACPVINLRSFTYQ